MAKPICKDVGRMCEFGEVKTNFRTFPETERVVTARFGYDEIAHEEPTGRTIKVTEKYKVCKYCGNEVSVSSSRKYV